MTHLTTTDYETFGNELRTYGDIANVRQDSLPNEISVDRPARGMEAAYTATFRLAIPYNVDDDDNEFAAYTDGSDFLLITF